MKCYFALSKFVQTYGVKMQALVAIGISASGKSYYAQFISDYHEINRDNIRKDILKSKGITFSWSAWNWKWEKEVTTIQHQLIEECAKKNIPIYISDTNLNPERLHELYKYLTKLDFNVKFKIFESDLATAIERDNARINGVGIYVIEQQRVKYQQLMERLSNENWFKANLITPAPVLLQQHKHEHHKINTLLVDIDGTIAHMNNRSPFDWSKVGEDTPDVLLCNFLNYYLSDSHNHIIFLSGRDRICETDTRDWISKYIPHTSFNQNCKLFMRANNDTRKDYIIKHELFFEHVDSNYNVIAVFDDRPQCCRLWNDIGLKLWSTGNQLLNW